MTTMGVAVQNLVGRPCEGDATTQCHGLPYGRVDDVMYGKHVGAWICTVPSC